MLAALAEGPKAERTLLSKALELGEALVDGLRDHPASNRVELAGSARRWADTCKDLDIVASASDPAALVEAFAELPGVEEVSTSGTRRREGAHLPGPAGGPADRARRELRQPAPALHRLGAGTTRRCAPRR